ncbi:MAG: hypothetical protein NC084_02295 [Bacteroides sp.]|nr:hypothetical protein [Roseburia sp.]MCM1461526.1 hypothetical protein [Bacteroides sp.]
MRGVNKLVMEVKSDEKYFERAILFLKPDLTADQKEITDGAERLLRRVALRPAPKKRSPLSLLAALIGCLAGAAATLFSLLLCGLLSF